MRVPVTARLQFVGAAASWLAVGLIVAGCAARGPAPVVDRAPQVRKTVPQQQPAAARRARPPADARPDSYTVRRGDTLYSIALDHGVDYRELARWNGITDPAALRTGERLRMKPPVSDTAATALRSAPAVVGRPITQGEAAAGGEPVKTQPQGTRVAYSDEAYARLASIKPVEPVRTEAPAPPAGEGAAPAGGDVQFAWPASGVLVARFDGSGNKGVAIAGQPGQPVLASAGGKVIYSGVGIRGMGKFIVIRHSDALLSVYAHNNELLAKYGETVRKGQKIAEMGSTDADRVKLYFEIRRYGKPVDPLSLLPAQPGG